MIKKPTPVLQQMVLRENIQMVKQMAQLHVNLKSKYLITLFFLFLFLTSHSNTRIKTRCNKLMTNNGNFLIELILKLFLHEIILFFLTRRRKLAIN